MERGLSVLVERGGHVEAVGYRVDDLLSGPGGERRCF